MFAKLITETVTLDGGVQVQVQKLSHRQLRKAQQAKSRDDAEGLRDLGEEIARAMFAGGMAARSSKTASAEVKPTFEVAKRARYAEYDRMTVLKFGILSWTDPAELTDKSFEMLDEETSRLLTRKILDMSLPPLEPHEFAAEEITRSKGSDPSTSS